MSGDSTVIDRSWAAMTTYMDWIRRRTKDSYAGQGAIVGDWLAFQQTSTQLMSDVYYGYSARAHRPLDPHLPGGGPRQQHGDAVRPHHRPVHRP